MRMVLRMRPPRQIAVIHRPAGFGLVCIMPQPARNVNARAARLAACGAGWRVSWFAGGLKRRVPPHVASRQGESPSVPPRCIMTTWYQPAAGDLRTFLLHDDGLVMARGGGSPAAQAGKAGFLKQGPGKAGLAVAEASGPVFRSHSYNRKRAGSLARRRSGAAWRPAAEKGREPAQL